ncbi:hypothetical protein GG344DRAFT_71506, partial [Lentinula edodes]
MTVLGGGPTRTILCTALKPPPPVLRPPDLRGCNQLEEEGLEDEDEEEIFWRAQARVERVRAKKAAAAAKKAAEEKAARAAAARERAAQEAREWAIRARQQEAEVVERRRLVAEVSTARSQRGTSPRRPVVEIRRAAKRKGKAKAQAEIPTTAMKGMTMTTTKKTEHLANGARPKNSLATCRQARGAPSSDAPQLRSNGKAAPVSASPSWRAKWLRVSLTSGRDRRRTRNTHQYLRQLLRRQEDDHARLIAMETRMAMMGMGGGSATAGPSRRTTEWRRPLKRRRIVGESDEEEEEEKGKEVEQGMEEDGEGEEEEEGGGMEAEGEGEVPAKTVASEKGKEKE